MLTEMQIKDIILAWAVRRKILLAQESVDDLAVELKRLGDLPPDAGKE